MPIPIFIAIGLFAGVLAGMFGIGGGTIIVPALSFALGYSQKTAAGTSLIAMLLPIGAAGAYAFYQQGMINMTHVKAGVIIALGMFVGSWVGAKIALGLPEIILKRSFCIFLVIVAAKMWMQTIPSPPPQ